MKTRLALIALMAISGAACQTAEEPELGTGVTFIQTVEVVERGGDYWAVVEGWYPDACSSYGGSRQEVDGDTINLMVTSQPGNGDACAQVLTDMTEEILLDTEGLDPGRYALIVNEDQATTTFVVA